MTNLKILYASWDSGICDDGIKDLNLTKLFASNNPNITNINHMTKLKILNACGTCGISSHSIRDLNLLELHSKDNSRISVNYKN
jgi:hypothetical protein